MRFGLRRVGAFSSWTSSLNRYELLALEQCSKGLTEERMVLAFQAFDESLPKLGVYSKLFSKLRNDFFNAIYSDELTGAADSSSKGDGNGFIQRLPYFILVNRVHSKHHEQTEELREQLDIVKKRLFDKHKQFEQCQQDGAQLKECVEHLSKTSEELQQVIINKEAEINRLQKEIESKQKQAENIHDQLNNEINGLKDSLIDAKQKIAFLTQFKKGYDDMSEAFMDKDSDSEDDVKDKQWAAVATKHAYTVTDIELANRMEEQILTVLNAAIEEFDKFLEDHKKELADKVITQGMTEAELDLQEMDLSEADQELELVQQRFQLTVSSMLSELELLQKHKSMLVEQMQILEDNKPQVKQKDTGQTDGKAESVLWAGLDEDEGPEDMADPFIPQERVFSKYAAMLYTSNNSGKTFEEFKDAKYCASCGEKSPKLLSIGRNAKTVICPHKIGGMDKVVLLPHNCTHIKIVRPKVRINKDYMRTRKGTLSSEPTVDMALSVSDGSYIQQPQELASLQQAITSADSLDYSTHDDFKLHSVHRLWADYKSRTNVTRTLPRLLTLDRTRSLLEQFCAYIIYQEDFVETDQQVCHSVLDMLYNFMKERYLMEDVMYLAMHDLLSSLIEYSGIDKTVQLLCHVLVGNLDASCLRYVLLMADFVDQVKWAEMEDFRAFASVVYPFLTEDDLENLQMSYTSFSENRISKKLVYNYLIHIILKYREPRFHDLENKLVPFQSSESGQLTDKEHKDALENVLPLCNERMRKRLFLEAEKAVMMDGVLNAVPIMRLAQITGYLALQQITPRIRTTVNAHIAEWRDRPSNAGSVQPTLDMTHGYDSVSDDQILTFEKVKTLASSLSRSAKHREERQNEYNANKYEDDDEEEGW